MIFENTEQRKKRRSAQDVRLARLGIAPKRPNKFRNKPTTYRGQWYQSQGEANYAARLDSLVLTGAIVDWERPKSIGVEICPECNAAPGYPCATVTGATRPSMHRTRIKYKPDFWVLPPADTILMGKPTPAGYYVDYKGSTVTQTEAWNLKMKLWALNKVPFELRVAYSDGTEVIWIQGLTR